MAETEEFRILTLPSTAKGTATVVPGRGVRINYIFYWSDAFLDGAVEQRQVPIRYDPFDAGLAYAFVRHCWRQCVSEHYADFRGRSERELKLAAAELRRQHQQHARSFTVTAHWLAEFLNAVQADEKLQRQRLQDAESRAVQRRTMKSKLPAQSAVAPGPSVDHAELTQADHTDELLLLPELTIAADQLEMYEEC